MVLVATAAIVCSTGLFSSPAGAQLPSSISTIVFDASSGSAWTNTEVTGASAYDTATLEVSGPTPTGTVTYNYFTNGNCDETPDMTADVTVDDGSVPDSASVGLSTGSLGAGSYAFDAQYLGDPDYDPSSVSSCELFSVGQATPTSPTITNIPGSPAYNGQFTANVDTDGDGTTSVTSSTTDVCTVSESDNLTVSFVGVGTCSLTPVVSDGTNYTGATGAVQSFSVGQATPTSPTITNIPENPIYNGQFTANVDTDGDGTTSVTSSTTDVCAVSESDNLTVSFVGVGTCSLTPVVSDGTNYTGATGAVQSFSVGQATPTSPTITNIPENPIYNGQFTADVSTDGDGTTSVTSSTTDVCAVSESDNLTVSFVGVGTCSLTPVVSDGTNYTGATGAVQSFHVGQATPTSPTITNIPENPIYNGQFTANVDTDGDGTTSVTSSTTDVCTVSESDNLTVSLVGVGTCSLTPVVSDGTNYTGATGAVQSFHVGQATPTSPTITNIPENPIYNGQFTADVSTDGDGTTSVTSSTTDVCTVSESDKLTVSFVGVGTCSLTPVVSDGTNYMGATGAVQSFSVGQATPTSPTITNIPGSPAYNGQFTANVDTDGDGAPSVASSTPGVCTVSGMSVSFVGVGQCTLTASVGAGTDYGAATGTAQSFSVGKATPSAPTISNIPGSPLYNQQFSADVNTDGDGAPSVASSTPAVCTVSGMSVSFVGVGQCTLTASVGAGTDYGAATGTAQSFTVGRASASTPSISNIPAGPIFGGQFTASVSTSGDGAPSVATSTPGVCTVSGLVVSFVGTGSCSLTASVAEGTDYTAAAGATQSFSVGKATPSAPTISNIPGSPLYNQQFSADVNTDGDGAPSVASSTPAVCTVSGMSVSFVGVGQCTLTASVGAGTDYGAATGTAQSFTVGRASASTPSISNIPAGPIFGGQFTASVSTSGDGAPSVATSTPGVCTVSGLVVSFVGTGSCSLTASVAEGTDYTAAAGATQTFTVFHASSTTPSIANVPSGGIYDEQFTAEVTTDGDGATSVTTSTPGECTVGPNGLAVSFVGVGTCTLTAHVGAGANYAPASGTAQSFSIGQATPSAPSVTNIPSTATQDGSFTATVGTDGDGPTYVVSGTTAVCSVTGNLQVSFITAGTCTLTAFVSAGTDYQGGSGFGQSFPVGAAPRGYWLVGSDGGIFTFGNAGFYGSTGSLHLQRPVVGITPTQSKNGYWLVASDGGIFAFNAGFYGSIPGLGLHPAGSGLPNSLDAPIVGMVPSNDGGGYFMVASDGGVFAFGDARFEGSCPGIGGCIGTAVAVMPDHSGNGYWLVTSAGVVYAFGDAANFGSAPAEQVSVTAAAATPDGAGYWLLYSNGAVYSFGDAAPFGGPLGYTNAFNPATAIFPTSDGRGLWVASARGDVFSFGNAPFLGSMSATPLNGQIIAGYGF